MMGLFLFGAKFFARYFSRSAILNPPALVAAGIPLRANPPSALPEELHLTLYNPCIIMIDGYERLCAEATLDNVHRFQFTAPLEPIAAPELSWYLEDYQRWPIGEFQRRAQVVETNLPRWGQALYRAALGSDNARPVREAWRRAEGDRRFTVHVDTTITTRRQKTGSAHNSETAATALLALPWELLNDGHDYLFPSTHPVVIAKLIHGHLSSHEEGTPATGEPPVRILLVCPRPDDDVVPTQTIDHRQHAQPLVHALADLGGLAALTFLTPPTLGELEKTLSKARHRHAPYTVVHLDAYGRYDRHNGWSAVYFEDAARLDHTNWIASAAPITYLDRLDKRPSQPIETDDLAMVLREHRVSMVFLTIFQDEGGYCRTGNLEKSVPPSDHTLATMLAMRLLHAGINAVVAMSHRVSAPTTERFLAAFYGALIRGERVGTATAQGRQALLDDPQRLDVMGTTSNTHLTDWFVPVLYQSTHDLPLFRRISESRLIALQAERRPLLLGALPTPPTQGFHGRSRELLALERRFLIASYAVITGPDGIGKTTLAVEMARWLVASGRFERAAFISLDEHPSPRTVVDSLGHQLIAGWDDGPTLTDPQAQQRVERALTEQPTLILFDNASIHLAAMARASADDSCLAATSGLQTMLDLCQILQRAALTTRLLFTSSAALPPPYTGHVHHLGILEEDDAIALVSGRLRALRLVPMPTDPGRTRMELVNLVQAVDRYPRALVLIVPELARHGVRATTSKLRTMWAELQRLQADAVTPWYAALLLALRTLPAESLHRVRVFAHFRGVASLEVIATILDLDVEEVADFAEQLIEVGLARNLGDGCLAPEPALSVYLTVAIDANAGKADWEHWLQAMAHRLNTLYKEWFRNANLSLRLTRWELPNLLTLLDWSAAHRSAEETLGFIWRLETLLAPLRLPKVLERVTALRDRLAPRLIGWGRAAFTAEAAAVERLLESGWLPEALEQAQALVSRVENAGDKAYPGAAHDFGMAHRLLSRTLDASGTPAPALAHLELARRRFQVLAEGGSETAARMASVCCTERGDCLRALGQLEAAATAYQEALTADEARGAGRDVAVNRLQLADIWRLQGAYPEALTLYTQAREAFTELRELSMVAVAWHQMGLIYQEIGEWQAAEAAYQAVLVIWVRRGDVNGEALTLIELGDLYVAHDRRGEAADCYRQAADRYTLLRNTFHEGQARRHLAETMFAVGETTTAQHEVERVLICQAAHANYPEPWKTWALLAEIERKQEHQEAAKRAGDEAALAYLAYRREGGEALFPGGRLCEQIAMIMAKGARAPALLERLRAVTLESPTSTMLVRALLPHLLAIIGGSRDPAIVNDPALHYGDSAELRLLLERLG